MRGVVVPCRDGAVGEPCGLIREQARGFDLRGHVRQLELNRLKFGDGFAELLALLGVTHGAFVSALRHAQAERGNGNAAAVENLQAVDEAFAFFAEQIFRRDVAIGENDFAGVAGAQPELVFFLAGLEAGRSLLDDERGNAVALLCGVGDGHAHADVGVVAVGGEGFRAVDDPAAVLLHGHGARAAGVGAGFRLGERPAAEFLALGERDDVFLSFALRCRIYRCDWCRANCARRR